MDGEFYDNIYNRVRAVCNEDNHKRELGRIDPNYKEDMVSTEILESVIADTFGIAFGHCQEIFCDLFGLALFGASYLRAFAYILSPGLGAVRETNYPTHVARAEILILHAVRDLKISAPAGFSRQFQQRDPSWTEKLRFCVKLAELATRGFDDDIWSKVDLLIEGARIIRPNSADARSILEKFRNEIPSGDPKCLGNITNAIWMRFDEISAKNQSFDDFCEELDRLNEMGLKSVEALEYRRRVQA